LADKSRFSAQFYGGRILRVGEFSALTNYNRRGRHRRGVLQPRVEPLIAALLPSGAFSNKTCPTTVRVSPPAPELAPAAP
jgi:hypothetical protein